MQFCCRCSLLLLSVGSWADKRKQLRLFVRPPTLVTVNSTLLSIIYLTLIFFCMHLLVNKLFVFVFVFVQIQILFGTVQKVYSTMGIGLPQANPRAMNTLHNVRRIFSLINEPETEFPQDAHRSMKRMHNGRRIFTEQCT